MVLFKRKPVEFLPAPKIPEDFDLSNDVWYIPETGEWFINYDDYLKRMDYYNIKKFVCETSGNSNFTFFEALRVELTELKMMELKFPEPVKEPILRYVSFSLTPRIDALVDEVYTKFKDDFFPGDAVVAKVDGDKFRGIVREKARFNPIPLPDGGMRAGYCSYRVLLEDNREITINAAENISRERNSFTKWYVKTFLKMSLTRSNRTGAPWIIRESSAKKYRISLDYPDHLKQFEVPEEPKESLKSKKKKKRAPPTSKKVNGSGTFVAEPHIFDLMKETPPTAAEQDAGQSLQEWKDKWYNVLKKTYVYIDKSSSEDTHVVLRNKIAQLFEFAKVTVLEEFDLQKVNFIVSTRAYSTKVTYADDDIYSFVASHKIKVWHYEKSFRFFKSLNITVRKLQQAQREKELKEKFKLYNESKDPSQYVHSTFVDILPAPNSLNHLQEQQIATPKDSRSATPSSNINFAGNTNADNTSAAVNTKVASKGKPTPAGPVEDLTIPFQSVSNLKPNLKKLNDISDASDILEIWIFINMYSKALIIDTFTFDDFYTALKWQNYEEDCTLLLEVYCSMFKAFMNESGTLLVSLPQKPEAVGEDEEEDGEDEEENEEEASNKSQDSIVDVDAEEVNGKDVIEVVNTSKEGEEQEPEESEEINHNAYSIIETKKSTWKGRLAKRQFEGGSWVVILLGILSTVEFVPEYRNDIIKIYEVLAPGDTAPTLQSLNMNFHENLSPDYRCKSLAILMNLLLNGSVIRGFMDKCLDDSTNLRRERLEIIKELKSAVEDGTNYQKEVMEALKLIDTTAIKERLDAEEKIKLEKFPLSKEALEQRRRGGRPVQNVIPSEPTELEKAVCAGHPEFLKLIKTRSDKLKVIEGLRSRKKETEKKINEIDIQRVKYIGRDRLFNRYWWFEKNGLPNLSGPRGSNNEGDEDDVDDQGLEDDEDSDYVEDTYLMGRLWIQGPGEEDRKLFLGVDGHKLKEWNELRDGINDPILLDEEDEEESATAENKTETQNNEEEVDVPKVLKKPLSESFVTAASKLFGLSFEDGLVKDKTGTVIVDNYGSVMDKYYSPIERKILEEKSDILMSSKDWAYIESPEDLEKLISWLNSDGDREKGLKKELNDLHEQVKNSLNSRVKSLGIGMKSEDQIKLEKIIAQTVIPDEVIEEAIEDEDSDIDVVEISDHESEEEKPRTRRARQEESIKKRKREEEQTLRAMKRAKKEVKPAERIAKREALKRKQREREEIINNLEIHKKNLKELLVNKNKINLLNWVNSSAIELNGYSHYEGPKIVQKAPAKKNGKKGGRKGGRR